MSVFVIVAVSSVLLTNVVARFAPFQRTTDPLTKFDPFTVSANPNPPATALVGDIEFSKGTGLLVVKVCAPDNPPPGAGLKTVTEAVPVEAMSLAGIAAVNCPPFTNVVVRSLPFHRTTEPLTKLDPFTVSVKPAPPTTVLVGEILFSTGSGLLMVNVCPPDAPPPGAAVNTVTWAVPAVAMSLAGIAAVN
jgi:hypothetical protein